MEKTDTETKTEQMVAPAKNAATKNMIAEKITPRVISRPNAPKVEELKPEVPAQIKLKRPFVIGDEVYEEGTVLEVGSRLADKLCRKRMGHYNFAGERIDEESSRHDLTRAERLN